MLAREEWSSPKFYVPSLEGFIAWLEKQPKRGAYDFNNCDGQCLMGQYMASIGQPWSMGNYARIVSRIDPASVCACFPIGFAWPHTFGGALSRARAALVASAQRGETP